MVDSTKLCHFPTNPNKTCLSRNGHIEPTPRNRKRHLTKSHHDPSIFFSSSFLRSHLSCFESTDGMKLGGAGGCFQESESSLNFFSFFCTSNASSCSPNQSNRLACVRMCLCMCMSVYVTKDRTFFFFVCLLCSASFCSQQRNFYVRIYLTSTKVSQ